jgi:Peptidase family M23
VPNRLFFSRLPTGELEFSCIVVLLDVTDDGVISWALRADTNRHSLEVQQPVGDADLRRGRAVLSAVLPPRWPDSILTVDLGDGVSEHEVRVFQQRQRFALPFESDVLVAVGHRIGESHRAAFDLPTQQFAWDLVALGRGNLALLNGQMSTPPRSADLACYGQRVLSPAPGVVVAAADGIADADVLGEQQPPSGADVLQWAPGNHVIISHDNGVHSCLAHLKNGSINVTVGQELEAGTVVGSVGNSGNTTGPHLHLHFMDGPDLIAATPLPIELTVEGQTFAPTSGQIVSP